MLYKSDTEVESAQDIDFDNEWLSDRIRDLPRAGLVVAFRLVGLLEAAVEVRTADEFRLYKEFEPQKSNKHSITSRGEHYFRTSPAK